MTTLPIFEEVNDNTKIPFLLFYIHQLLACLIGMQFLTQLQASINIPELVFSIVYEEHYLS